MTPDERFKKWAVFRRREARARARDAGSSAARRATHNFIRSISRRLDGLVPAIAGFYAAHNSALCLTVVVESFQLKLLCGIFDRFIPVVFRK